MPRAYLARTGEVACIRGTPARAPTSSRPGAKGASPCQDRGLVPTRHGCLAAVLGPLRHRREREREGEASRERRGRRERMDVCMARFRLAFESNG